MNPTNQAQTSARMDHLAGLTVRFYPAPHDGPPGTPPREAKWSISQPGLTPKYKPKTPGIQ